MANLLDRLKTALADRYTIEHELGAGGMATVYLAEDLKHHRKVAVKVLRPDLAAALGPDRFIREIEIAANLTHPHIVPLYDSGEADGFLYYVLPYIEGESLREKLTREGELPVGDAVRILRDVVDALSEAHDRGVVHRDIKPDNVMITKHHAVVTDFGVAKAVSEATGRQQLTTAGVALGTPAYMAPEQAVADPHIDHRADIYAVGAMAYELLTGRPPFAGNTPQAILSAHVTEMPDPVSKHRESVPPALDQLVMKCLEKKPADRWQSAEEILHQLEAIATPSGGITPTGTAPISATAGLRRSKAVPATLVGGVLAVVALGWLFFRDDTADMVALDPSVVAVLPFRVTGATLSDFREGMVDYLHGKFTGEVGPRAVDPRTTMSAWRGAASVESEDLSLQASVALAERVGAGQVLLGGMVAAGSEVTLNAAIHQVPDGEVVAEATVRGHVDSLLVLIDGLVAQLLTLQAGESESRLGSLSPSLDAVRAYLMGNRALRHDRALDAVGHFDRAIAADSSFGLAAIGLTQAGLLAGNTNTDAAARGGPLAWTLRDSLSARDRAWIIAGAGRNTPGWTSTVDRIADAERAVELAPDNPDTWSLLAQYRYVRGQYLTDSAEIRRGIAAMRRALALDSTHLGAAMLLANAATELGDTALAREYAPLLVRLTVGGERAGFIQWGLARVTGDGDALARARNTIGATQIDLTMVGYATTRWGLPYDDWEGALANFEVQAVTERAREQAWEQRRKMAMLQGRVRDALAYSDSLIAGGFFLRAVHTYVIQQGIFSSGYDSAAAAKAADLERLVDDGSVAEFPAQCTLGMWKAYRGDTVGASAALSFLNERVQDGANPICAEVIDVMLLQPTDIESGSRAVERLDSLLSIETTGVPLWNAVLARAHEVAGDHQAALRAVRRQYFVGTRVSAQLALPFMLREEGRLATTAGDTAAAIDAYQHYLAIRTDPDPVLQPEVDEVRRALAALVGEGGR